MLLAAAILTASINVDINLGALIGRGKQTTPSAVTCGIKTVGYRFVGTPGQEFRYGGESWKVPAEGSIELIAVTRPSYSYAGRSLPLDAWPQDQFGFREVALPQAE